MRTSETPPASEPSATASRRRPSWAARIFDILFALVAGAGPLVFTSLAALGHFGLRSLFLGGLFLLLLLLVGWAIRRKTIRSPFTLREFTVLVILVVWGLVTNHLLLQSSCTIETGSTDPLRPLAVPHVYLLAIAYASSLLAYALSRRRPEAQRPWTEAAMTTGLAMGLVIQALLAVQFSDLLPFFGSILVEFPAGLLFLPLVLPLCMPYLALFFFGRELFCRLRRRGAEQIEGRAMALRVAALAPAAVGLYALVHRLWLGRFGVADVFTQTCGHVFSKIPVTEIEPHGHYLCTVAARGHPWLVRPERWGQRNGRAILVNRQLAVANAFEDLLRERWPRAWSGLRRTYDRLGLPVSRFIRSPLLSDAVYLLMKPAEWGFYLALLLADPRSPEERIDRMYRP